MKTCDRTATIHKIVLLIAVILIVIIYCPAGGASAEEQAQLIISGAEGSAGETVEVVVRLEGMENLSGVSGLTGGDFILTYDSEMASLDEVEKGSLIKGSLLIPNLEYDQGAARVLWVYSGKLIEGDGELCIFTFTMKKDGALIPGIENIEFCDQDVNMLAVGASSETDTEKAVLLHPSGSETPDGGAAQPGVDDPDLGDKKNGDSTRPAGDDEDTKDDEQAASDGLFGDGENRGLILLLTVVLGVVIVVGGLSYYFSCRRRRTGDGR